MIGARVIRLDAVDSTNDVAARLAAGGEPEGTAVVAATQRAGRGRQGRPWYCAGDGNLCLSVILRPGRPLREWPDLSWALAAGVAEFARAAGAHAAVVKHPNDVLVEGRKLAGLLLETRSGNGDPSALVAGVGVNVNACEDDFPAGVRLFATSLAIVTGRRHDCEALLGSLLEHLDVWHRLWEREGAAGARLRLDAAGLGAPGIEEVLEVAATPLAGEE